MEPLFSCMRASVAEGVGSSFCECRVMCGTCCEYGAWFCDSVVRCTSCEGAMKSGFRLLVDTSSGHVIAVHRASYVSFALRRAPCLAAARRSRRARGETREREPEEPCHRRRRPRRAPAAARVGAQRGAPFSRFAAARFCAPGMARRSCSNEPMLR